MKGCERSRAVAGGTLLAIACVSVVLSILVFTVWAVLACVPVQVMQLGMRFQQEPYPLVNVYIAIENGA